MDKRRLTALIALVVFVGAIAGLTYYDWQGTMAEAPVAFAPAVSTDESIPAGETPIVPPASLVEPPAADQTAPETSVAAAPPVETPPAMAAPRPEVAAAPPAETPPAMAAPKPEVAAAPPAETPPTMAAPAPKVATAPPAKTPPIMAAPKPEVAAAPPAETPPPVAAPKPEVAVAPPAQPSQPTVAPATGPQVAMAEPPPQTQPSAVPAVTPTFDVVRVEPSGDTVVAGLAAPGSTVEVLDGPQAVAKAEANTRGEWALALDKPLPPGTHDLAIRTTSQDQKVTTLSDQRVAVSVPDDKSNDVLVVLNTPDAPSKVLQIPEAKPSEVASAPPAAPQPAAPAAATEVAEAAPPPAQATPEVATAEPTQTEAPAAAEPKVATAPAPAESVVPPAGASEVASAPAASEEPQAEPAPAGPKPAVTVAAVEADTAGGLYVAGTAETDEPVRVYVENQPIGEAKPTENGTWLVETKREMPAGTYDVRADQVDKTTGDVIARAEVSFERDIQVASLKPVMTTATADGAEVTGEMPKVETVIIKRGDNLWRIARDLYGRGIRYSTIYQANKDQIRNPHWIYPGQVFVVPAGNTDWQK